MLHFSTNLVHEASDCFKRVREQIEAETKPVLCREFSEFSSKYSYNLGKQGIPPDPTLTMSASYQEIKAKPDLWLIQSPKS
jgi:hypothetical protein